MSEINIHFFNVDNGDSIIIESIENWGKEYILIDSNLLYINNKFINPAYNFLKSKNVTKISTIIITHLHQDHYNGIEYFLKNFDIKKMIIPPFLSNKSQIYNKILKKVKEKINFIINSTNDNEIFQKYNSLAFLFNYIYNNDDKIEQAEGKENILRFPSLTDLKAIIYLPLSKIKGQLHQMLTKDDFDFNNYPKMNDSSIAICLKINNNNILLTGDSTFNQWQEHKRQMERDGVFNLNINLLKAPHHGSKYDNREENYSYFFKQNSNDRQVIISANGIKHPDKEIFNLIKANNLIPYCTNLSQHCVSINMNNFRKMGNVPNEIKPFLLQYIERKPTRCQGNIHVNIKNGKLLINSQFDTPCVYR